MTRPVNSADAAALAAFVAEQDAALFIGSGVSLWSGLPSWPRFIQALIDHAASRGGKVGLAQAAMKDGRLADAADSLGLPPLEIAGLMRDKLGFAVARPHRIHGVLTQLGPERFITTNYDTLIEQQLGLEGRMGPYRTVTASRVAEMADIVKASADRFIFKPHGDIGDAGTMIVSARDYERVMLGGGNLVRQGLETLLVSRPVLFIGFGLRDPDLNLVLRALTDNYLGNIHHFYAIVADLSDEERDYWHDRFRIRAFGYPVVRDAKGNEDHSGLLDLLDAIVAAKSAPSAPAPTLRKMGTARVVLPKLSIATDEAIGPQAQLTRFAASLVRERMASALPLKGMLHEQWGRWVDKRINELHFAPLGRIIEDCPTTLILVGQAGSGKSHAIREYLSIGGTRLLKWLTDDQELAAPPIPILLDARLYDGSFETLLKASVPERLDLVDLAHRHRIDLIIDSIDEMPQVHLDGGAWRADLVQFIERFAQHRLIYGSRRAALVGDPKAAIFHIDGLDPTMISQHLVSHGLSAEAFSPSLLNDVDTPFELGLMTEFGAMIEASRSISSLIAAAIDHYIARVPNRFPTSSVAALLRSLAFGAVIAGRETIAIEAIVTQIATDVSLAQDASDARELLEGLVRSGLIISEVQSQVRFVHRSVTEYLCSTHIMALLGTGITLAQLLASRRWDDPLTWALSSLDGTRAPEILPQVYAFDHLLALRIVTNAERDRADWWVAFLDCLIRDNLKAIDAFSIGYATDSEVIPIEAVPTLRVLAVGPASDIRGWAWGHYAKHASESELWTWIDWAATGQIDFNEAQFCASDVAAQLDAKGRRYFRDRLVSIPEWTNADDQKNTPDSRAAHCFAMALHGFDERQLSHLFNWSRKQPPAVARNLCLAIYDEDSPVANRFLTQLFDERNYACCAPLNLKGARYGYEDPRRSFIAPFTLNRFEAILDWIDNPDQTHSSVSLLRNYLKYSDDWRRGVRAHESLIASRRLRPLRLLFPDIRQSERMQFITRALAEPARQSVFVRAMMNELGNFGIILPEEMVLGAMCNAFTDALILIQDWLGTWRRGGFTVTCNTMDRWISILSEHDVDTEAQPRYYFWQLTAYLAQGWSLEGRSRLIARGEASNDPLRDFVLANFIPALPAFNFAELTGESAARVLELYMSGRIDDFQSLGRAATEAFVEQVVLPRAAIATDVERERLADFLDDAGKALDRRYRMPPTEQAA